MQGRIIVLVLWVGCLLGCSGGTPQTNKSTDEASRTSVPGVDMAEKLSISDDDLEERGFVDHWTSHPVANISQMWVLQDNVYITRPGAGSKYLLEKINGDTGRLDWSFTIDGKLEHRPAVYRYAKELGNRDDELFVVQHLDSGGEYIFCLDDKVGAENYRIPCSFPISTPVAAGENHVFVGSWNYRMYSMSKATQLEEWSWVTDAPITAAPEVGGLELFVGSEDRVVYAFNQGGGYVTEKSWKVLTQGKVVAPPVFFHDRIYVGSWDYKAYALSTYQGQQRWATPLGAPIQQRMFPFSDWVFAVTESEPVGSRTRTKFNLNALDQGDGTLKWERKNFNKVLAADKFHCYALNTEKAIHAIRLDDGVSNWSIDVSDWDFVIGQDAQKGAARELWGRMFLATRSGVVQCIRPRR